MLAKLSVEHVETLLLRREPGGVSRAPGPGTLRKAFEQGLVGA